MPTLKVDLSGISICTNDIYYPLYFDQSRYLVLVGGAGSGKSHFAAQKMVKRALSEPKLRMIVVRKVAKTVSKSTWLLTKDVISQWGMGKLVSFNKTEMVARFLNGAELHFIGLDDPEKIKSIQGINSIWIEEATELTQDDFLQLDLRLRGQSIVYKQVMLTFNPISATHWLKKQFFEGVVEAKGGPDLRYSRKTIRLSDFGIKSSVSYNATMLKTTYRDNRYLDPEYTAILEGLRYKHAQMHRIYADGEWGILEGLVYAPPNLLPPQQWPDIADATDLFYSMDFGYTHPTVLIEHLVIGDKYYERSLLYETGVTTDDLRSTHLPNLVKAIPGRSQRSTPIYADCAEPDRIDDLKRAGWNVIPSFKGKHSIKDGIDFVRTLTIFVLTTDSPLLNEYNSYCWAQDQYGNPIDEPVDLNNHAMDARRYGYWTRIGKGATTTPFIGGGFSVKPAGRGWNRR